MKTGDFKGRELVKLPQGFRAAGVDAGIKTAAKLDMAMLVSDIPAVVAGAFTTNRCAAAPVQLCRKRIEQHGGQAVVINSGIANAATGAEGLSDALTMAEIAARGLQLAPDAVYVCSTGSIGPRLPMNLISNGIKSLVEICSADGGEDAALAIMTTDTRPKRWTVEIELGASPVTLTGIAKGAGMIEPNMATMLAFIMTDAAVDASALQAALAAAVGRTFNRITVDGDMSTNDTVLIFANGAAGNQSISAESEDWPTFVDALEEVASRLAWMIVEDGEGATKLVTITVRGAADAGQAECAARSVANSFLVKTAWAGDNPAAGRIVDALGYSGVALDPARLDVGYDGLAAIAAGVRGDAGDDELRACVRQKEFRVDIDLHQGPAAATVYTCNITEEYVRINM